MKREVYNLGDWWEMATKQKKKKKLKMLRLQKKLNEEGGFKVFSKKKRGRPRSAVKNKPKVDCLEEIYSKYVLEDEEYFNLTEIISFIKRNYGIDIENKTLKDEQKQELKSLLKTFFDNFIKYIFILILFRIVNPKTLLLPTESLKQFLGIVGRFEKIKEEEIVNDFTKSINKEEKHLTISSTIFPQIQISESQIKDHPKKKHPH